MPQGLQCFDKNGNTLLWSGFPFVHSLGTFTIDGSSTSGIILDGDFSKKNVTVDFRYLLPANGYSLLQITAQFYTKNKETNAVENPNESPVPVLWADGSGVHYKYFTTKKMRFGAVVDLGVV